MSQTRISTILYLILLTPYGMGVKGIGLFNSLDIPKIGMLLALVVIIRSNAIKVNSWYKFGFNLLVGFHLSYAIFYMNRVGIKDFIFVFMFGYVGGYLGSLKVSRTEILHAFTRILQVSVVIAIVEFWLQYNFLDGLRNIYNQSDTARFNSNLGMIRLGMKASMGQYASTLPFAYNTFIIYVFLRLEKSSTLTVFWRVLSFVSICFTLSRAVIFCFFLFETFLSLNSFKKSLILFLVGLSVFRIANDQNRIAKYLSEYVLNIVDDNGKNGLSARISNNTTDFSVLSEVNMLTGLGPGSLATMKRGLSDTLKLDTSDSGIVIYTLVDRGLLSVFLLLLLYLRLIIRFIRGRFKYYFLLVPLVSFLLLSVSYRYEVLFLNFFFLMYYNERITVGFSDNTYLQSYRLST